MAALVVVLLITIRLTGPELAARYNSAFVGAEELDGSAESRVDLWLDCLKVVQQYPVLGVGPWNWQVIASSFGWTEGKSAHSLWMESAAEVGIPGVLALFAFFGLAVARLWPIARTRWSGTSREDAGVAAGVAISIVGFAVAAQFVSVSGLEVPYYVTLVGAALIRLRSTAPESVVATVLATAPATQGSQPPASPSRPAEDRPRLLPRLPARTS
jgi:hypothetical protein